MDESDQPVVSPTPGSKSSKRGSHSRKGISRAKETDAALNASNHSINSHSKGVNNSEPSPGHNNNSSNQLQHQSHHSTQAQPKGNVAFTMSEQAARLGLYN